MRYRCSICVYMCIYNIYSGVCALNMYVPCLYAYVIQTVRSLPMRVPIK